MRYDTAYEVVDRRRSVPRRLKPLGIISTRPGAVVVIDVANDVVEVDPDSHGAIINHDDGSFDMPTPDGPLSMMPITQSSFAELNKALGLDIPPQPSDEALGAYLYEYVTSGRDP